MSRHCSRQVGRGAKRGRGETKESLRSGVGGAGKQRQGGKVELRWSTGAGGGVAAAPEHHPPKQVSIDTGMMVAHAVAAADRHGARDAGKERHKCRAGHGDSESGKRDEIRTAPSPNPGNVR